MKINDAVFGALLLLLGLVILVHVQSFPKIPGQNVGPALFPGSIAAGLCACALLLIRSGVRSRPQVPWLEPLPWLRSPQHVAAFLAVVGATIFYIVLVDRLGFLIVSPLALFAMFFAFRVRPLVGVIVAVAGTLVIWYAFYKLLRVPLPWGLLERFAF